MPLNPRLVQQLPERKYVTAATGAINFSLDLNTIWQLLEVRIHLSAAGGAGNLTITNDSGIAATVYDTVLATQDMTAVTDYVFKPEIPHAFFEGDVLKIAWPNAQNKTYGLEVIYSKLK
jgi:hypothetical protein